MAVLCMVVYLGWHLYLVTNDPFNDWWFDQKIWKAQHNSTDHLNPRGKMAYDLQHRVLKPNMTRKQVLQILGPSDAGDDAKSLSYNLGAWSGIGLDGDIFVVEFGKTSRVVKVYWFQT